MTTSRSDHATALDDEGRAALTLALRYDHAFGALRPFFDGLEAGIARATRCASCARAWCPPRLACECGGAAGEWIDLEGTGTLVVATSGPASLPLSTEPAAPVVFALVALDGAANRMFARVASRSLGAGTRVRLVRDPRAVAHPVQRALFVAAGEAAEPGGEVDASGHPEGAGAGGLG